MRMIIGIIVGILVLAGAAGGFWLRRLAQRKRAELPAANTVTDGPAQPGPSLEPKPDDAGLLKDMFATASTAMYDIDIDHGKIHWNEAFYTSFGHQPDDKINTLEWWATHIHPEDAMVVNDALDQLKDPTVAHWTVAYRFRHADGSYTPVSDHTTVVRNQMGEAVRIIGSMAPEVGAEGVSLTARKEGHADKADTKAAHESRDAVVKPGTNAQPQ